MTVIGKHITADMYGCKFELLDDRDYIKQAVLAAIAEGQLTLLQYTEHPLTPQGVAAIALLTESHISVHTYPHLGYAAVDIFTFSEAALPTKALQTLRRQFKPTKLKTTNIRRGDFGSISDMKPKTRTLGNPLRRVKDTSTKFIKFLSRSRK